MYLEWILCVPYVANKLYLGRHSLQPASHLYVADDPKQRRQPPACSVLLCSLSCALQIALCFSVGGVGWGG